MGLFDTVKGANPTGNVQYIQPGKYIALVTGAKEVQRGAPKPAHGFAIEMYVLKQLDNGGGAANPEGSRMSDYINALGDAATMFAGSVKATLMGILEMSSEEFDALLEETPDFFEKVTGPEQFLRGYVVEVEAWQITTQKNKQQFTRKKYVRAIEADELAEMGIELPAEFTATEASA